MHACQGDDDDDESVARAHFGALDIEDVGSVRLGDFVEVQPELESDKLDERGQPHAYVMQIMELFQTAEGERMLDGHWFYKTWDTALRVRYRNTQSLPGNAFDPERLFKASAEDNAAYDTLHNVATIHK
jgi:hypothetical protein